MIKSSIYQLITLAFLFGSVNLSVAQISAFPYSEFFEAVMGAWVNESGDDMDWTRDQNGTPSGGTGPASGTGGGATWHMFTEVSGANSPNKRAYLEAEFDFTGEFNPQLTFMYHMFGGSIGELHVDVFDGVWYTSIWSMVGGQQAANGDAYREGNINLTSYENRSGVKIRFSAISGTNWDGDIAIDDVSVCTINPGVAADKLI